MASFAILFISFLLAFNSAEVLPEKGVSKKLAFERAEEISELRYSLHFSIPMERDSVITAKEIIGFDLKKKETVILDFRHESEYSVKSVFVNGKKSEFVFGNEHIIIPAKHISKGKNILEVEFIAGNQSLNRREDLLYTLLVPDRSRTLFPCFDQPNLKAKFTLTLDVPNGWEGVANGNVKSKEEMSDGRTRLVFSETAPISTYLFSFVAGKLQRATQERNGRAITIFHRESDPKKTEQVSVIFDQIFSSLDWLEHYTAIKYPFAKYDIVIIPGFQYGGMEHMGATLYSDRTMFIDENATISEQLDRAKLIAHETAHMWFGDFVTMEWFDDVWTKEVFANWFASQIVAPLYPEVNHRLNFINTYYPASYSEDRTAGSNSIQQELDNLNNAGLVYGNIIYNKAPIVMEMLVKRVGEENFRLGIQAYLRKFAYSNASWDDLIKMLDSLSPEDLQTWSNAWVKERGMPSYSSEIIKDSVVWKQSDPFGRGILLKQDFSSVVVNDGKNRAILPNTDGRGYGLFLMDSTSIRILLKMFEQYTPQSDSGKNVSVIDDEVTRASLLISLNENMLAGKIMPEKFVASLLKYIQNEDNTLLFTRAVGYLTSCYTSYLSGMGAHSKLEQGLWNVVENSSAVQHKTIAFRAFTEISDSPEAASKVYEIWKNPSDFEYVKLSERDLMRIAYEMSIRFPEKYDEIFKLQLNRITNTDRKNEFAFIFPATSPLGTVRDSLFNSLLDERNREIEPWAASALGYMNHYLREKESLKYIKPGLEILPEIQKTGDIFFPRNWLRALLGGHNSVEAKNAVNEYLNYNRQLHPLLRQKVLQQADNLFRTGK
jgi:aminopeptidase N